MNYLKMLLEQFQRLATWQKVTIGVVGLLVFFGVIGAAYFYSAGNYTLLYRGLDPETAASIKERLDEGAYQYKIADNGTTIYVASSQKEVAILKLAKDNVLPDRSKGYADIFGTQTSPFSNSRKIEDLNIVRGLQAELETTIRKASPKLVTSVRVHISYAPERAFREDQKQDKAIVSLVLKPGKNLDIEQITGIRNLVANGANVPEDNVRVFDQNLKDLTKQLKSGSMEEATASDQYALRRKFETELAEKLQEMLNRVLGNNQSVVYVSAELNFNTREVFEEKIEPPIKGEEGGMVVSEESADEVFEGKGKKPVGVPGTQSNIPTYPDTKEGQDKYSSKQVKKNYEFSKNKTKMVYSVGGINKLSVSVVLDDSITKEQLAKVENVVYSAGGIDRKRGDVLVVEKIAFNREVARKEELQAQRAKFEDMLFQLLLVIIPTLTIFFVLWFVWKNKELIIMHFKPIEVKREPTAEDSLPAEVRERTQKVDIIKDFIAKSPKDAAALLQIWLTAE